MTIPSHSPGSTPAGILFSEEAEEFEPLFSESPLFRNKEDVLFGRGAARGEGGEEA
eukprot:CAMPEP_0181124372 /NCGR_PEP_ID=MMETSP1071-20121207/26444_1 /TAXON_ID=35127 /ORGANISM="Thalassiosira sp., Strain NH16" /LENGTH=55 /DNA_ID=CAMNT_0023209669 /DNA_START=499 /DNA_END=666 /DNA_ORIENTATION=+